MLARAPRQLPMSCERPELRYELAHDLIAIHGGAARPGASALMPAEGIAVHPAGHLSGMVADEATVGPVYRRVPSGSVVVPTGRVLVRFAESEIAEHHRAELAEAGYDIEEALSYAPHAAWLRAHTPSIAETLAGLDQLATRPGIENVEPQMVGEVSHRD